MTCQPRGPAGRRSSRNARCRRTRRSAAAALFVDVPGRRPNYTAFAGRGGRCRCGPRRRLFRPSFHCSDGVPPFQHVL